MFRALAGSLALLFVVALISCQEKKKSETSEVHFTKEDSLTERYLLLQDSMLHAWNLMMNDDNQKLKSMKHLLHEMAVGKQADEATLQSLQQRLDQLWRIRFTQRTMANQDLIEEYDFATNTLVTELLSLANNAPYFEQNTTLQSLVENITLADQRVLLYRNDYDAIVKQYNAFLQQHKELVKSIDDNSSLEDKPLFGMSEDSIP
jgi:hypothetical protein